jgi:hypothetical protein
MIERQCAQRDKTQRGSFFADDEELYVCVRTGLFKDAFIMCRDNFLSSTPDISGFTSLSTANQKYSKPSRFSLNPTLLSSSALDGCSFLCKLRSGEDGIAYISFIPHPNFQAVLQQSGFYPTLTEVDWANTQKIASTKIIKTHAQPVLFLPNSGRGQQEGCRQQC